jgi:hypothetical protein
MKATFFYILSSILLLFGGIHLFAETQNISPNQLFSENIQKKAHLKHKNSNRSTVEIQFAAIGLEEDFHSEDNKNTLDRNKITTAKSSFLNSSYVSFFGGFIFKEYSKLHTLAQTSIVSSNPIYLRIGVLRI